MSTARRYLEGLRAMSPDLARYFLVVALVGFALDGGVYAVLLNLFLDRLAYGPEAIGLINSAGTLTFAITSLPAGLLGARFGSRQVMIWGLVLMAVSCLGLPFAVLLSEVARLAWLIGNTVLIYLGLALYFVNTAPVLLGFVSAEQRTQAYSQQTALLALSSFLGSLAGGLLPTLFSSLSAMPLTQATPYGFGLFVAGLSLIPAIIATIALRPVPLQDEPVRSADRGGAAATVAGSIVGVLALIALVRTLQVSGLAATSNFFNLYLDSVLAVPTAQIGVLMALGRLVAVPAALSTAALTNRYGNKGVVIGASLATAASMLPIALIPHWGAASLSFMAVISLSWIRYAASIVFFLNLVPPRSRAVVSGVTEMAAGICFTALTFGGGYIIAYLGYETLFLLGAGLTALSALLFWLLFRGREPVVE